MAKHNTTGTIGEKMAVEYLQKNGFDILHKNWRHGNWEVDIIASQKNILHFIEVKTRRNTKYGYPEDDVNKKKILNLINASEEYLLLNPKWKRIQFDILSININYSKDNEFFFIEDVSV